MPTLAGTLLGSSLGAKETAGRIFLEPRWLLNVALHGAVVAVATLFLDVAEVGAGTVRSWLILGK
jgi:hypothetical protein